MSHLSSNRFHESPDTNYTVASETTEKDWQNLSRTAIPHREQASRAGFSILSFDGGGFRGYASLLILRRILKLAQPEGKIFPYLYFDLICGTSTGGLIAILLAVLYLDIDTAIEIYRNLGKTLFGNSWRKTRFWLQDAQFNHRILREMVADIVRQYGRGRKLMYEPKFNRGCLCFVTVAHCGQGNPRVCLIKSYQEPDIPHGHQWSILDAALATSAAPTYFKAHHIRRSDDDVVFIFEDAGAHGANNPTEIALEEFRKIDNAHLNHYLVSIGTGARGLTREPRQKKRGKIRRTVNNMFNVHRRARELAAGFARYATDTAGVEQRMELRSKTLPRRPYFRFNPPQLGDIDLADYTAIQTMEDGVGDYFGEKESQFTDCANLLAHTSAPEDVDEAPPRPWWETWRTWLLR